MKNRAETLKFLMNSLRKQGIRITHQRQEIVREIVYTTGHPSIGEVFHAVRERVPTISLDTVYRTVKTLTELGLIHPVGCSPEGIRFDSDRKAHHHFLCSVCGEAIDFVCPELDAIPIPVQARIIGTVTGSRVEVRGVCKDCLKKQTE